MKYLYNNNNNFPSSFSLSEFLKYLGEVNIEIAPKKVSREKTTRSDRWLHYYTGLLWKMFFSHFFKENTLKSWNRKSSISIEIRIVALRHFSISEEKFTRRIENIACIQNLSICIREYRSHAYSEFFRERERNKHVSIQHDSMDGRFPGKLVGRWIPFWNSTKTWRTRSLDRRGNR